MQVDRWMGVEREDSGADPRERRQAARKMMYRNINRHPG